MDFSCHRHSLRPACRLAHEVNRFPSLSLPQTRFLRPVPSRDRPSFFPSFSHHAVVTLLSGACTQKDNSLISCSWGRIRKHPPFPKRSIIHHASSPHAIRTCPLLCKKAIKKACSIATGLSSFSGHTAQAIARTPFPERLPRSRPCRRHAAPAGTRPARLPGTGPSAGCSCCPGPPAGGCHTH